MGKKAKKEQKLAEYEAKKKGFFTGFKDFIAKGNVVDLAVGVVIGAAFGKIVNSLVNDIIMPPIGVLINGVDFKDLVITLRPAILNTEGAIITQAITINYGNFIMTIIEFLIIAFCIYAALTLVIRRKEFNEKIEKEAKAKEEAERKALEPEVVEEVIVPEEILLLREISEALKKERN